MFKVASFKISEAEKINELLSQFPIATGAHVFVSNGELCIPYEDGEPDPPALQSNKIREQQLKLRAEMAVVAHTKGVVDLQIADSKDRLKLAEAAASQNRSNKQLQANVKQIEDHVAEGESLNMKNNFEIVRIQRNIDLYEEEIKKLGA